MSKQKVLILTYTDLNRDPIVLNQISWLKGEYDLHVVCAKDNNSDGVTYHTIESPGFLSRNIRRLYLKLGLYRKYTWSGRMKRLLAELTGYEFDLIIVHHLNLLPLAFEINPRARVLFYAHEYYMRMYDHSFLWRIFIKSYFLWLADNYIHKCDYLITVNESIKEFYEEEYKIKADFIQNRVPYEELSPAKIDPANIKILHHGLASTNRKLETMIELMKHLDDRFSLTIILQSNSIVNQIYVWKLKLLAAGNNRIKFLPLVPIEEVAKMGNKYDIGLFFLPPTTINIKYNLANKVFQYVQSRLMLVVSPLPEIEKIVEQNRLGIAGDDFDPKKLAEKINKLTAQDITDFKESVNNAALPLSSAHNKTKLLAVVDNLLNGAVPVFGSAGEKKMEKVLIFTYTDIRNDAIVLKQIDCMKGKFDLSIICRVNKPEEGVKHYPYPSEGFIKRNMKLFFLKGGMRDYYIWDANNSRTVKQVAGIGFDMIIVHHIKLLPLAFAIAPRTKILFYAHEYYPEMYDHSLWWRVFVKQHFCWIGDRFIPKCDYLITVNESIKKMYEEKYGIKSGFIHNVTKYCDISSKEVDNKKIKILHHGLASTSRRLEEMIKLMNYLDERFTLTLVLQSNSVVNDLYIKKLKFMARGNPRIEFKPLVGYNEIVSVGNQYDIGIFIMPRTTTNEIYSLGHKVFQYIQSRLMLVVTPLPEMKRIVEKYDLGISSEDFDLQKLAEKMNGLTAEKIFYHKSQAHKHARELGVESENEKFLNIIENVLNQYKV